MKSSRTSCVTCRLIRVIKDERDLKSKGKDIRVSFMIRSCAEYSNQCGFAFSLR